MAEKLGEVMNERWSHKLHHAHIFKALEVAVGNKWVEPICSRFVDESYVFYPPFLGG